MPKRNAGISLREWLREEPFDCAMNPSFLGIFAHTGCLGALQREGLLYNLRGLAGASAGAMCGAVVASGRTVLDDGKSEDASELALHPDLSLMTKLADHRWAALDVSLGLGLLNGQGFEDIMAQFVAPSFEELQIPFACTAWSAYARRTEILRTGPLPRAVRASATVPGLLQPTYHNKRRWLLDGGIGDPSGSVALRALPEQPRRSLHIVVNRRMVPGVDSFWTRLVPPSRFGAPRTEVTTVRLNRPPDLLLGDRSFKQVELAILATAEAVLSAMDTPMQMGEEVGHHVLEVDVAWNSSGNEPANRSRL